MRSILALVALVLVPAAGAHTYSEHGNITTTLLGLEDVVLPLIESTSPTDLPQGVLAYRITGVQGGDAFQLAADDGIDCGGMQPPCLDDECPSRDYDSGTPAEGTPLDKWVDPVAWSAENPLENGSCQAHPDFDVRFTAGGSFTGYGDEQGTVPGDGDAVVTLFYGDPGEGFTYSES